MPNAAVTPFKIATLTEALKVCKNKMFIFTDKAARWRYADVSIAQVGNPNYFLFEAMVEADNYNSIVLSYGYLSAIEAIMIQKYIYERTSVVAYMMIRDKYDTPSNTYDILSKKAMPNSFAIQINGSYNIDTFPDKYSKDYAYLKDKCVMLSWTIVDGNYPYAVDTEESWEIMYYDIGYRMIMTNSYMDLVKYAAAIYERTNGN